MNKLVIMNKIYSEFQHCNDCSSHFDSKCTVCKVYKRITQLMEE